MAKYAGTAKQAEGFIVQTDPTFTYEGGLGFGKDAKSELFLLAISSLVEDKFYESASEQNQRLRILVREVMETDEPWVRRLIGYLRQEIFLRSVPIVIAAEYASNGGQEPAAVIGQALQRADEPAEMLAYWLKTYGRKIPKGVKRGIARSATRLYHQFSYQKYAGKRNALQMADVIEMTHPKPQDVEQSDLFKYILDVRHAIMEPRTTQLLDMITTRQGLNLLPEDERRPAMASSGWGGMAKVGGITWEFLSGWIPGGMDKDAWEAVIPRMGYMALLRNLRNFEQAGISDESKAHVTARLIDPEQVAKSKQFPIRFFTAWANIDSLTWGPVLEKALDLSVQNVTPIAGRTLVLADVSGSMYHPISENSKASQIDVGLVFAAAFASANPGSTLATFSTSLLEFDISPTSSVLRKAEEMRRAHNVGGGTWALQAMAELGPGHDNIVMITDEQFHPGPELRTDGPVYVFNVAGYRSGGISTEMPGRYVIGGGFTDAAFRVLELLDRGRDANWPF